MDRIRAAWGTITASPRRIAATGAVAAAAVIAGVGFSLAVGGLRDEATAGQSGPPTVAAATLEPSQSASATPTPTLSASPSASPSPTATSTPMASATPTPAAISTPAPTPTPNPDLPCDDIAERSDGRLTVNGQLVDDPTPPGYGEQMPIAVLRLAARATADADPDAEVDVCIEVELPGVIVTGEIEVCGDVRIARLAPLETPPPVGPAPTSPPRYAEPMIGGVQIGDQMLDINTYPMFDIADVLDAPACLLVQAQRNDVWVTTTMDVCAPARLTADGELIVEVDDLSWPFEPDDVQDEANILRADRAVDAQLTMRNLKDDVVHLVVLEVQVEDCEAS